MLWRLGLWLGLGLVLGALSSSGSNYELAEKDEILKDMISVIEQAGGYFHSSLNFTCRSELGGGVLWMHPPPTSSVAPLTLLEIPRKFLLCGQASSSSTILQVVLREYLRGDRSGFFHRYYFPSLPQVPQELETLVNWEEDDITQLLQDAQLARKVFLTRKQLKFNHRVLQSKLFPELSFETYVRVNAWLQSRTFTVDDSDECLVPVADMLNHRFGLASSRVWTWDKVPMDKTRNKQVVFSFQLLADGNSLNPFGLAQGQEVRFTYSSPLSNEVRSP